MTSRAGQRRPGAAIIVGVALAVSACGTAEGDAVRPAEPSTPAAAPGAPAALMVRSEGLGFGTYGELALGMTADEVAAHGYRLTDDTTTDTCVRRTARTPAGKTIELGFGAPAGPLETIGAPPNEGTLAVPDGTVDAAGLRRSYPGARFVDLPATDRRGATLELSRPGGRGKIYYRLGADGVLTDPRTAATAATGCL